MRIALVIAVLATSQAALSHDWQEPGLDGWYNSLKRPLGHSNNPYEGSPSCCSKTDCHPTQAEIRGNTWWARLGHKEKLPSGEYDWKLEDWVPVPPSVVLQNQSNPTGSAVICHQLNLKSGGNHIDPNSPIWCFVPPTES